ncbi:BZ3500_MvSof-1268-A1-R1_Chr3-1g05724 [Microbotryum saponariae]|uniref:BZ3500_MvSof-1268-A1-R1_Chr3-1g05724 protein n=1 Tax=Microbotryum saponariae TaxID=289078 RepID=A0A2X0N1A0_9BASI|nr:BZ3500_MvSof-1268-A1-R1_Chr3-1g05724 [Microbotryum saponariae]SDA04914.1 BZ3501_MvSof-1269-A2-R1_Chr3-1g05394 [Microbotryum saponariae]
MCCVIGKIYKTAAPFLLLTDRRYHVGINNDPENDQQKKKNGWTRSRTWRFSFLDGSASRVDRRCVEGFPCVGFRRIDRSFALVKIYGMDREERSLVFLPALETQPREDIRRCRGDE